MLYLTRREGERIRILAPTGEEIWIVIKDIGYGKVRLGLDAPREWEIMREELIRDERSK